MKSKEQIIEILMKSFKSVYCDTCASQETENGCDYCHRKSMNWKIHEAFAEEIADEILK